MSAQIAVAIIGAAATIGGPILLALFKFDKRNTAQHDANQEAARLRDELTQSKLDGLADRFDDHLKAHVWGFSPTGGD